MTREIKFRYWSWWKMHEPTIEWSMNVNEYLNEIDGLMQYTWLNDKNWKEIYEWDIVRMNDNEDFEMEVIFTKWGFEPVSTQHRDWVSIEIIWNIYQNKNLLNQ